MRGPEIDRLLDTVPSPQPALVRHVDEEVALRPLIRPAAAARLATIVLVLAINATQLRSGAWKRPPLYSIGSVLTAFAVGYVRILVA